MIWSGVVDLGHAYSNMLGFTRQVRSNSTPVLNSDSPQTTSALLSLYPRRLKCKIQIWKEAHRFTRGTGLNLFPN